MKTRFYYREDGDGYNTLPWQHHKITAYGSGSWLCTTCRQTFTSKPRNPTCLGIPMYRKWENIPETLKTKQSWKSLKRKLKADATPTAYMMAGDGQTVTMLFDESQLAL